MKRSTRLKGDAESLRKELLTFLLTFDTLSGKEAEELSHLIPVAFFKKKSLLVQEGEENNKCFFVLKGCLREYRVVDGDEKTTHFYTEHQAAVPFSEPDKRAVSYLSCVEDSILIIGEMDAETTMYEKYPKLESITRAMLESDFAKTQNTFSEFIIHSPEERYLSLLKKRSDLLQRVPQHQIASYLGMTPESLSRIRKRLQQDN